MKRNKRTIQAILRYGKPAIGIFGSHSAKETAAAAKISGFKTVLVVEKGREDLYTKHNGFLYDEVIVLGSFKDLLREEVQDRLIELNVIFIPNRSLTSYIDPQDIEKYFYVPMYGSKYLLKTEDRSFDKGQYYLLEKANLRFPKQFRSPEDINKLAIVKVQQAGNKRERAFFYVESYEDFKGQSETLIEQGVITREGLEKARIEEYVLGPRFNADFHSFALKDIFGSFAFVGLSDRIQVNLQGYLNLTAKEQLKIKVAVKNEEIGHKGVTMRESKQILLYEAAEAFIYACLKAFPPGMIGMFGLQGAIAYDPDGKLEFVIFDVSPRVPGDPAIGPTSPEMRILSIRFDRKIEDPMDLTMMEIERAWTEGRLEEIVT
ncbi:MAG: DUF1297 domain-containing protein [Candidatus Paceibacterota bacterium]|jgi:5-formaminoimidazole-4-carboxamide-1-(beta)-D-ribofuranosyl 5'-monophosphate synthetase